MSTSNPTSSFNLNFKLHSQALNGMFQASFNSTSNLNFKHKLQTWASNLHFKILNSQALNGILQGQILSHKCQTLLQISRNCRNHHIKKKHKG